MEKTEKISVPVIDISRCTLCDSCIAIAPEIFQKNFDTGLIEVIDLPEYSVEKIEKVINICPTDCIIRV